MGVNIFCSLSEHPAKIQTTPSTLDAGGTLPTQLAQQFRSGMNDLDGALHDLPPQVADRPWRIDGWTGKQIVGHLLDSAANNRQRFVRAAIDGSYEGPGYEQKGWVAAHGYADQSWATLLRWWVVEKEILIAVVDCIPEERLEAPCLIAGGLPVTLRFLIVDYLRHHRHHLEQLASAIDAS